MSQPGLFLDFWIRDKMKRIPGIDGLRAIAVSLVLLAHFGLEKFVPGGFGVTLFFFISGLLITTLLVDEYEKTGNIAVSQFYIRRLLRLYPALILAVVFSVIAYQFFGGVITVQEVLASIFYYANYFGQIVGFGSHGQTPVGSFHPLSILWSLAIEEQYYLVFPFVVIPFMKNLKNLLAVFVLVAVFSLLWRFCLQYAGYGHRIYAATDTRIDSIIFGAILALLIKIPVYSQWVIFLKRKWVFLISFVFLLGTFLVRDEVFRNTLRYSIQGIALMSLVTFACFSRPDSLLSRLLACRPMVLMGGWSYSLYLFHGLAILISENAFGILPDAPYNGRPAAFFLCQVVLSFAFAWISYYGVEMRFMKLRKRFGSQVEA